jgi:glutaredoxin
LTAWADSLGGILYPLLSDFWPHGEVARRYGVLRPDGKSERAIFIIDPQGLIRYIDIHDIDDQPDNAVLFRELARLEPELAEKQLLTRRVEVKELPHGGIVMYCTPWCPDCKQAKSWLKACGQSYTEVDISRNEYAAEQVRAWNGGSLVTPTFDIDGTILSEFDPQQLSKILKI